jgi:NADPH:quinone reductase-like Zn-dependent oxidoreductase
MEGGRQSDFNGCRVGETHFGSYAQKARVKGDWFVELPARRVALRQAQVNHHRHRWRLWG